MSFVDNSSAIFAKILPLAFLFAAASELCAYDKSQYQPGDFWTLEECFLINNEGVDWFKQGDFKVDYDSGDPIWFYLMGAPNQDASLAEELPASGLHRLGPGWAGALAPSEDGVRRIEDYPFIVRNDGADEKTILVHPGEGKELIVAWQAPITGRFKAEAVYQRLSERGDGQHLTWLHQHDIVAEKMADEVNVPLEVVTPEIPMKKSERLYFCIGPNGNNQDDSGTVAVRVSYLGP